MTAADDAAGQLVDLAVAAHGGPTAWPPDREIAMRFSAGGFAFAGKGHRRTLHDVTARVAAAGQRVTLTPYPRAGRRGVFDSGEVRIEDGDGIAIAARRQTRADFRRLRRQLRWDDLDLLYFTGAALWTYLALPFALTRDDITVTSLGPWTEAGQRWQRLGVRFPPHLHTHSGDQVLYLDGAGRIRRHDYTAEAFGAWARAAQYCHDHRHYGDLLVPTRRRVHPRRPSGAPLSAVTLVHIDIHDVSLQSPAT